MDNQWTVEMDQAGAGRVTLHTEYPFTAFWTTGEAATIVPERICWNSLGSCEEDSIQIFDPVWLCDQPAPETMVALLEKAAATIDDWISQQF